MPLKQQIKARDFSLNYQRRTLIMGVMNLTPDSFSADGRFKKSVTLADHLRFAKKMVQDGADILDVGAESSRPGAAAVSEQLELRRLLPTLRLLKQSIKVPISVDTYKPAVAEAALEAGASIINNIHGLSLTKAFVKVIARYNAALVLMHMRGDSKNMHTKVVYKDLMKEISDSLSLSIEFCLENGIKKDKIIVDPGIGFAKTVGGNLCILRHLASMKVLKCPILVGPSRKSFIGAVLERPVTQRLLGTAASVAVAIANGANFVRVHDVAQIKETVRMTDAIVYDTRYD